MDMYYCPLAVRIRIADGSCSYQREASALSVQPYRAVPGPQIVGRATVQTPHAFRFYVLPRSGGESQKIGYIMPNLKHFFLASALCVSATVCLNADDKTTVRFDIRDSQARVLDVYPSTYVKPVIAELSVDTAKGRIRDTWTLTPEELASRTIRDNAALTMQNLRTYAVYKSSEQHNCDVVIAATFDIRLTEKGATITIVGYPANFANWQTGTVADYDWIKYEPHQIHTGSSAIEGLTSPTKK